MTASTPDTTPIPVTIAPTPTWNSLPQAASGGNQVGRPLVEQGSMRSRAVSLPRKRCRAGAHRRRSGEVELHLVLGEQRLNPARFARRSRSRVDLVVRTAIPNVILNPFGESEPP